MLQKIRNEIFSDLPFKRSDRVLVVNAGHGLLLWEAFRRTPEGLVVAQVNREEQFEHIQHYAKGLESLEQPVVKKESLTQVLSSLEDGLQFEKIIGRNLLSHLDEDKALLDQLSNRLAEGGILSIAETVPSEGSRLSELIDTASPAKRLLLEAEASIYGKDGSSLANWKTEDLKQAFDDFGWSSQFHVLDLYENRFITQEDIKRWITTSYRSAWEKNKTPVFLDDTVSELTSLLAQKTFRWKHHTVLVRSAKSPHLLDRGIKDPETESKGNLAWKETESKTHFTK